jgi:hypothetical protein
MRVLVACEESQVVCKAFRRAGHEAFSADLQDCSGGHPEWHIKGDVLEVLNDGWDMMIAHPECKFLCQSGIRWMTDPRYPDRVEDHLAAVEFFKKLWNAPIEKIAIENSMPMGRTIKALGRYTIMQQPYHFGDPYTKAMCWWLKGLKPLIPTHRLSDYDEIYSACHYEPPGPNRSRNRAKTLPGPAEAMAQQWGNGIEPGYRDGLFSH